MQTTDFPKQQNEIENQGSVWREGQFIPVKLLKQHVKLKSIAIYNSKMIHNTDI